MTQSLSNTQSATQSPQKFPKILEKKSTTIILLVISILTLLWIFIVNPLVVEPTKMKMVLNYTVDSMERIFINQFEESIGKSNIKVVENAFQEGKFILAEQLKEAFNIQMLYSSELREKERRENTINTNDRKVMNNLAQKVYALNLKWPIEATAISSGYGNRTDPYARDIGGEYLIGFHDGIDIMCNLGDKVMSSYNGVIKVVANDGTTNGLGKKIIIDHGNGIETIYGHLSLWKVKVGQIVKEGQVIGLAGSTGRSTGNHLHFTVKVNGVSVNPKKVFRRV